MLTSKLRRGKVFKAWLIYYSIILLLPIALAVIVYYQAINIITAENKSVRQASLHQLGTQIDADFQLLRSVGTTVLLNEKMESLGKVEGELTPREYYALYDAGKDIKRCILINGNGFVQNIYVYFNRTGCMLSDTKTLEQKSDIADVAASLGFGEASWQSLMKTRQQNNYYVVNTAEGQKLFYLQSISFNNGNEPLYTVIVVANTPKLTDILGEIELPQEGTVAVLGENGGALSVNRGLPQSTFDSLIASQTKGGRISGNLVVISLVSRVSGCKYVLALPNAYYQQKVQYIQTIVWIYLAVCLTLGFVLVYYFSRHNYLPLEKLRVALESEDNASSGGAKDEFSVFEGKIHTLISKKDQLQKKLTDNNEITRNNILYSMLKGRQSAVYQKAGNFTDYDLVFKSESFSVVLFEIENVGEKLFSEKDEENAFPIVAILIKDIFNKVTGDKYSAYFIECDGQIAGIVNHSEDIAESDRENAQYEMQQVMGTVVFYVHEHFDVSLSATVSTVHKGLKGIRDAFGEASDVFEYKQLKGETKPVMRYSDISLTTQPEPGMGGLLELERQFYEIVVNGDYKGAYDILRKIVDSCSGMGITSLHTVKFRMFGLVNIMLDILGEIRADGSAKFLEKVNPIDRLLNASSLAELQKETIFILDSIIQHFEKQSSNIENKMDAVTAYINHQYFRSDLGVQQLSEKFGMSVSYLSRTYKKTTGEGLLDCIHRVRIQKAKAMLAGGASIKTVAEKTGYYNSQALIRAFRRYEGITPGQYRDD